MTMHPMRIKDIDCTCKGCVPPERHMNCHATCEKYLQYKRELQIVREKKIQNYIDKEVKLAGIARMRSTPKSKIGVKAGEVNG